MSDEEALSDEDIAKKSAQLVQLTLQVEQAVQAHVESGSPQQLSKDEALAMSGVQELLTEIKENGRFMFFHMPNESAARLLLAVLKWLALCAPVEDGEHVVFWFVAGSFAEQKQEQDDSGENPFRTEEHARLLFQFVLKVLEPGQAQAVIGNDAQDLCPPLMTFMAPHLRVLKEMRQAHSTVLKQTIVRTNGNMLREFLLGMTVNQDILCLYYNTSTNKVESGYRLQITGVSCNAHLREVLAMTLPEGRAMGAQMELTCWTPLKRQAAMESFMPDCIWGEGIIDDIAPFRDEIVVVFSHGRIARSMNGAQTFPAVQVQIHNQPPERAMLSEQALADLLTSIQECSQEEYETAIRHQMGTGGSDDALGELLAPTQPQ